MNIAISRVLLLLSLNGQMAQSEATEGSGAVRGRVVDAAGSPVAGATVSFEPTDGGGQGIMLTATTDARGDFLLDQVPVGTNMILASKTSDYYPEVRFAFFAADGTGFPRVRVSRGTTSAGVVVRLTEKGARLIGTIVDSQTKQPVITSRIRFIRRDDPKLFLSTSPNKDGRFDFVVPSRPFLMEVSAPGYRTWSLPNGKERPEAVSLPPESVKEQLILLEREATSKALK